MSWRIDGNLCIPQQAVQTADVLPKGTYYVRCSPQIGYYLEQIEDFKLPNKIYGSTEVINRQLTSYHANQRNTGIILTGIKGSGKTLLSKKCAIDSGLPVIIIDKPYNDADFISFITNPELGDICVFIDEFEKVYNERGSENAILTILDGAFNTHNLFIFTCNLMHTNEYLTNRPSRIRYRSHFESLPEDIINEVIEDLLQHKEHADSIRTVLSAIGVITFDLLITLIKEVDLFNEPANVIAPYLNIVAENIQVDIVEIWKGKPYIIGYGKEFPRSMGAFSFRRSFEHIPDPEYCDEDYCGENSPYKGLPEWVSIPWSEIKQLDNDHWEYKGELGHFRFDRYRLTRLVF